MNEAVDELADVDPALVRAEGEGEALRMVGVLWQNGWQPAELVRQGRRHNARTARLVTTAVAADHGHRAVGTLHPQWAAQVDQLDLHRLDAPTGWLGPVLACDQLDRRETVVAVVELIGMLYALGPLPVLIPPPGNTEHRATSATPRDIDATVLAKVRALLAQAESTSFEAEAASFTAKAQELMSRHSIDAAMAWAESDRSERPVTVRLAIDEPYDDIKAWLLQIVATHNRCRAIRHVEYGLSSVLGFAGDVTATEVLFTSLLVQSQIALRAEGATAAPGGRTRSRSFRSSFLMAYAHRIDARLAEANAAIEDEPTSWHPGGGEPAGEASLPVLAERGSIIDEEVHGAFGTLRSSRVRGGDDWLGYERGRLAADRAQLQRADLTSG